MRLAALLKSDDDKIALAAAKEILDRGFGRSIATTEITGADGGALVVESGQASDIDTARRICWLLGRAGLPQSLPTPSPNSSLEEHEDLPDTHHPQDDPNTASRDAENLLVDEIIEGNRMPDLPPEIGTVRKFGHPAEFSIICLPPSREGLPPMYELSGGDRGRMQTGSYPEVFKTLSGIIRDGISDFNDSPADRSEIIVGAQADERGYDPDGRPNIITAQSRRGRSR